MLYFVWAEVEKKIRLFLPKSDFFSNFPKSEINSTQLYFQLEKKYFRPFDVNHVVDLWSQLKKF